MFQINICLKWIINRKLERERERECIRIRNCVLNSTGGHKRWLTGMAGYYSRGESSMELISHRSSFVCLPSCESDQCKSIHEGFALLMRTKSKSRQIGSKYCWKIFQIIISLAFKFSPLTKMIYLLSLCRQFDVLVDDWEFRIKLKLFFSKSCWVLNL